MCNENNNSEPFEKLPHNLGNGEKFDGEKVNMGLLPLDALETIAQVLEYGAKKYAPDNWKKVPDGYNRYKAALLRHLAAIDRGENVDNESGLPHIAHVACNAIFMVWFDSLRNLHVSSDNECLMGNERNNYSDEEFKQTNPLSGDIEHLKLLFTKITEDTDENGED